MPVIGMEPALKPASLLPGDGYVVVMATHMTLTQPKFLRLMERYGQNALPVPCPGLMECVEAGVFSGPRVEGLLDRLLASVRGMPVKAVVLGCTHYPIIRKNIMRLYPSLKIVNPSYEIIARIKQILENEDLLAEENDRENVFYASDLSENFVNMIQKILETEKSDLILKFKNLDL